ncbi:hypothetical protein KI387_028934, partial [Taxus chinensis]
PREVLEDYFARTEVVGSVDTGVSPFLEAQIAARAKQLEKLSANIVLETRGGVWCTDCNVEGNTKDNGGICTRKAVRAVA